MFRHYSFSLVVERRLIRDYIYIYIYIYALGQWALRFNGIELFFFQPKKGKKKTDFEITFKRQNVRKTKWLIM